MIIVPAETGQPMEDSDFTGCFVIFGDFSGKNVTTKERILNEALTLFAENGYDGTSMEQIATKVGIKAPSLYKQ